MKLNNEDLKIHFLSPKDTVPYALRKNRENDAGKSGIAEEEEGEANSSNERSGEKEESMELEECCLSLIGEEGRISSLRFWDWDCGFRDCRGGFHREQNVLVRCGQ